MKYLKFCKMFFIVLFSFFMFNSCEKDADIMSDLQSENIVVPDENNETDDPDLLGDDGMAGEDEDGEDEDGEDEDGEDEDDEDEDGEDEDDEDEDDEDEDGEDEDDEDEDGEDEEGEDEDDEDEDDEEDDDYYDFLLEISDCFEISFPFSVILPDNTTLVLNDEESLERELEAWILANPDATELPSIQFPIEVVFEDGSTQAVDNEEGLVDLIDSCPE